MIKKASSLLATAYLLIIFCIYPFYVQDGYVDIGNAKNRFFLHVSIAAFCIMGICAILYVLAYLFDRRENRRAYLIDWNRVSSTDLMVMLYASMVFLSYVFTDYREEALWGTDGWYIGCVLLLLLCGLYFLISRMWNGKETVLYALMAASALVFLLGICNRFSFYPIKFDVLQPDFISTLGNINWYCGYLSVTAPVGIGMFVLSEKAPAREKVFQNDGTAKKEKKQVHGSWKKWFCGLYVLITFMAAFSQGSDSIFLWFPALFFVFLFVSIEKKDWFRNWMLLLVLWMVSAQLIRLMRYLLPGKYNYDANNLCGYFTGSSAAFWALLIGAIAYTISRMAKAKRVLLALALFVCGSYILLAVINTKWGIPVLKENAAFQKFFFFDQNWGNGRGAAYDAGIKIFGELPLIHKFLGAGPDCFSIYAYSIQDLAVMLNEKFGSARLTNAHNELLTGLVNTGILGICFYIGILISFLVRCLKKGKENPVLYLFAACVFCYLVHNMVSFAQVLNLPFVFLLTGMGEQICKGKKSQKYD